MSVRRLDPVQPASFAFSPENLAWAKKTIDKYPPGKQASAVIPVLWRAQEQNDGWVSQKAIETVADLLGMSYIRVLEVATFYTMFQLSPVGTKAHIQVCGTTPCMLRGAEDLKKVCQRKIHHEPHHLNEDGSLSWEEVECLGACVNAPMVQVFKDTYEDLTPAKLEEIIDDFAAGRKPKPGSQIGRQFSAPEGGPTALTDKALYAGQRTFTRVEPPPPPPPAAAPATAQSAGPAPAAPPPVVVPPSVPAPAAVKPAPQDLRPVSEAAKLADAAKTDAIRSEEGPGAPGKVTTEKAQAETGILRTTADKVVKAATKTPRPVTPERVVPVTDPKAPPANTEADRVKPRREPAPQKLSDAPEQLKKPRAGSKADDLKLIWGVGPGLEKMLNKMGFWHFDQIGAWTAKELKWVDENLKGFKGRATRDEWVKQAKKLATGRRPDNAIGDRPQAKK